VLEPARFVAHPMLVFGALHFALVLRSRRRLKRRVIDTKQYEEKGGRVNCGQRGSQRAPQAVSKGQCSVPSAVVPECFHSIEVASLMRIDVIGHIDHAYTFLAPQIHQASSALIRLSPLANAHEGHSTQKTETFELRFP